MRGLVSNLVGTVAALAVVLRLPPGVGADGTTTRTPQYQLLPSLREQAEIVDAWTEERKALIPGLMRKYGVDAWLVRPPSIPDFLPYLPTYLPFLF